MIIRSSRAQSLFFVALFILQLPNASLGSQWGFHLGTGASSIRTATFKAEGKPIPSLSIGVFQNKQLRQNLIYQWGVHIQSNGCKTTDVGNLYLHNLSLYVSIPASIYWTPGKLAQLPLKTLFGLSPAMRLLSINEVGTIPDMKRWDLALYGGLEYSLSAMSIGVRLQKGMISLFSSSEERLFNQSVIWYIDMNLGEN